MYICIYIYIYVRDARYMPASVGKPLSPNRTVNHIEIKTINQETFLR